MLSSTVCKSAYRVMERVLKYLNLVQMNITGYKLPAVVNPSSNAVKTFPSLTHIQGHFASDMPVWYRKEEIGFSQSNALIYIVTVLLWQTRVSMALVDLFKFVTSWNEIKYSSCLPVSTVAYIPELKWAITAFKAIDKTELRTNCLRRQLFRNLCNHVLTQYTKYSGRSLIYIYKKKKTFIFINETSCLTI